MSGTRETLALFVGAVMVLATGCASLGGSSPTASLERKAVFHPAPYPQGDWRPTQIQPENVWFAAADGTRLHGWYVRHPDPQAVVLLCHGNAGNITSVAETLAALNKRHSLTVMTFDYRGYGRSAGTPTEDGILQDARAARAALAKREGIVEDQIVLMGVSLGGAVAVDLAARDGARGLILASTFTSLPDVAKAYVPLVPARWVMSMRLNSLEKIKRYHGPVLISHGDADELIPYEQGKALYASAPGPKKFVTIAGGKHNDAIPAEYALVLDGFLAKLPPAERPQSEEKLPLVKKLPPAERLPATEESPSTTIAAAMVSD